MLPVSVDPASPGPAQEVSAATEPIAKPAPSTQFYTYFDPEELEQSPFHKGIERDEFEIVERLLKLGVNTETRPFNHDSTPLMMALSMRSMRSAKLLLEAGANVHALSTVLGDMHQQAVMFGNDDDESLTLVESRGLKFSHLAHEAAYHGRIQDLQAMSVEDLEKDDSLGLTSIHYAAAGGNVAVIKTLLEKLPAGTVARKSRFRERTPLHCAVLRDRVEAIEFLLKNGSSVQELDMRGDNVLIMAARLGRIKSLKCILDNKLCDLEAISAEVGDTALTIAAHNGQVSICECLLDYGAKVEYIMRGGLTPLLRSAQGSDRPEIIRLLVSRGANLYYKRPTDGTTAVTCAILGGNIRSLSLLVDELGLTIERSPPPVNLACGEGSIAVARWLMQRGFPLNERDSEGLDAMGYAALCGSIPTMKWLHRHGLSYAARNANQSTLMHIAAAINRPDMLRFLLATGQLTADEKDEKGVSPIMTAASRGAAESVQVLLDNGASLLSVNIEGGSVALALATGGLLEYAQKLYVTHPHLFTMADNQGNAAIHYASALPTGVRVLTWLLQGLKQSPSRRNNIGVTPLMLAAETGCMESVKLLLEAGASPLEEQEEGTTVIHFAASKGSLPVMKLLVSKGAKPGVSNRDGDTSLTLSIRAQSLESVRWLIEECHIDPSSRHSNMSVTPLMVAAITPSMPIVKYLLEEAKVNRSDRDEAGRTALLYAAGGGSVEITRYLLERGARVKERDSNDVTALLTAVEKGAKDVAMLLIGQGADPHERTREGADCVLTACYCGQVEMLKWLVKGLNMSLDTEDTMHNRAVHCAAASAHLPTLTFVLEEMPAELNVTNGNGHTPVEICAFKASPPCVRYLLSKNCLVSNIDPRGNTTVHLAAAGNNEECFRLILHTPGSLHAHLNNEGISAASIAEAKGPHLVRAYREFLMFLAAREGKLDVLRDLHHRYDIPLTIRDPFNRVLSEVAKSPEVLEFLASDAKQHSAQPSKLDAFFIAVLTFTSFSLLFARK